MPRSALGLRLLGQPAVILSRKSPTKQPGFIAFMTLTDTEIVSEASASVGMVAVQAAPALQPPCRESQDRRREGRRSGAPLHPAPCTPCILHPAPCTPCTPCTPAALARSRARAAGPGPRPAAPVTTPASPRPHLTRCSGRRPSRHTLPPWAATSRLVWLRWPCLSSRSPLDSRFLSFIVSL
jgi:hypothetical protein